MENFINKNADFFDRGQGGNPLGSTPVNTTIDASTLNQAQPLNLPTAPVDTNNYAGIIQSVPTMQDITQQIQGTSQTEQSQQGLAQRLLGSLSKLGGRKEAQLQAEQQVGLPQFQTQLTDVNNQLQSLQKEALAIPLQLQQDVQGRGVTAGGLAPIQTGQLRQNAIKSLTLSAIGQTLQGNIANAQAQADRAVELEFAPLEAEVETLKQAYQMNKDFLEREDKKKADALNFQIQERTRVLNEQKDDKKTVLGFVAEAAKNGAPTLLLQRASEMESPSQALSMLSQYMSDPLAKEQALADLAYKRAQIAKTYAELDKLKIDMSNVNESEIIQQSPYQVERNTRITNQIDALMKKASIQTVGFASLGKFLPASLPRNFKTDLDTLKANIAFGELQAMREASKTGGALGQVSERELALLESAMAGLDQGQSPANFKKNLQQVKDSLDRWRSVANKQDVQVVNGVTYIKGEDGLYYKQ